MKNGNLSNWLSKKNCVLMALLFFCTFIMPVFVFAFSAGTQEGHGGITEEGVMKVTWPEKDGTEIHFSKRAIKQIIAGNTFVDDGMVYGEGEFWTPEAHFDDELLFEGSQRLLNLMTRVILSLVDLNGEDARKDLGRATHTLQDFYAHSNWVNFNPGPNHKDINPDLGLKLISPLSKEAATCIEEIIVDDKMISFSSLTDEGTKSITTGYFSLTQFLPKNKCAHGGPLLSGLYLSGINKDKSVCPFFREAKDLAIPATTDYINKVIAHIEASPLIDDKEKAIKALFNADLSIAFVIDTTGSMSDDINGVKARVNTIINRIKLKLSPEPDKYVLVEFGDPYVGEARTTQNPEELLNWVNAISLIGNPDCPELSLSGLIKGIEASSSGGNIYVFTDADAKDKNSEGYATAMAEAKNIKVNPILTGSCSTARDSSVPVDPVYQRISAATGGQLVFLDKSDVEKYLTIIEPTLSGDFQPIMIIQDTLSNNEPQLYSIPVDSTMTTLVASVNMNTKGEITLLRPSGFAVKSEDSDAVITELPNGSVINISKPSVGNWQLSIKGFSGVGFSASVNGNSQIGFERFKFVQYQEYRGGLKAFFPVKGRPLAGTEQTAIANLIGSYKEASFSLISENGSVLKTISLVQGNKDAMEEDFVGSFDLPKERCRVAVRGKDQTGAEFLRVFPTQYLGQSVKVELLDNVEIIAGKQFKTHFKITNLGNEDTFRVSSTVSSGSIVSITPNELTIGANASKEVEILADVPLKIPSNRITLTTVAQSIANPTVENSVVIERSVNSDVFYYPFNGNANDESSNGQHATVHEAVMTKDRLGTDNGAYDFNGTTGFISTPIDINPDKMPTFTMMAWVYPRKTGGSDVFSGRRQILSHDDGNFDRSLLMENNYWNVFTGGSNWYTGVPVDVKQWQHVAVVFEASDVKFYKNGVMYAYGQAPGNGTSVNKLTIGENPGEWVEFFDGIIDDVRIYKRALAKEEIQAFYPKLTPISISGLSTVPENSYSDYKLMAVYSDGMTYDLTPSAAWTENSNYASLDTTVKGRMKTSMVSVKQTVTLTAKYTYNGVTQTASIPLTIVPKVLTSVSITGGASSIKGGSYSDYTATAHFDDGTTQDVTKTAVWTENSTGNADCALHLQKRGKDSLRAGYDYCSACAYVRISLRY